MKSIGIARAYDLPARRQGVRFLVDRLWPRGIRKEDLPVVYAAKDPEHNHALVLRAFLKRHRPRS